MARKTDRPNDLQNTGVGSAIRNDLNSSDYAGRRTVVAVFDHHDDAEHAVRDLKDAGFTGEHIGLAMRDRNAEGKLVEETGTHAGKGAATGAVSGGLLGGLAGLLIGTGALLIPGIGPVVAGGILATTLGTAAGTAVAGAGIGAAAGGLVGGLVGLGVPEEDARYFESSFRSGGILVTVDAENRAMEAVTILQRNNGKTGSSANGTGDVERPV